jgi:hypothetical protein
MSNAEERKRMKTKHLFAAAFVLGLFWTGYTFANAGGPPGEVNGVTGPTCYQANCHNTAPSVNFGGVLISIGGLPANWTPSTTYNLTVTISRAAARYGFQFSAVSNATNAQAGTLLTAVSPADPRVSIVPFNGRQYAQHNAFANTNGVFNFRWTAPADAGGGAVRFNVAGNAANGDFNNTGDFIYATSALVSPAAGGDTTPPVITSVVSGGVNQNSATITWTTDEDSDSTVEYGTNTLYGSTTTNATPTKTHSITLLNLAQSTTFHFRVKSKDAAGNVATGADATFITSYSIVNLGGVARTTDGAGSLAIGYAKITPGAASTTPSGVGIFGYKPADVLVTEAGVPDSPLITSGRIYAEESADLKVRIGVAMANPNPADVTVNFEIRNTAGTVISPPGSQFVLTGTNTACVPTDTVICNQMAKFLDEAPFSSGAGIQGTLSFTSSQPISVIALRGFFNERPVPEFLITTLPVLDLSAPADTGTRVIPHFVAGESWTTQVLLVNPTASVQTGTIQVLNGSGAAQSVRIDSTVRDSAPYSVAGNSSQKFTITGAGPTGVASGSIRVVPTGGGAVPTPLVIFSLKAGNFTVSETGVPVIQGSTFRMYAELNPGQKIRTGVAIANATSTAGTVLLSVTGLDGLPLGSTAAPLPLPASGQIVGFIDDLIPSLAGQNIQGVLRLTTTVPTVSVVALRLNRDNTQINLMTTTPPTVESGAPGTAVRVFPHAINGGGFTTQFILFSGTAGQAPAGDLSFTKQSGEPLVFDIK